MTITKEELEAALRDANTAFVIATNVTENTGQPVKVNGISQLSTLRVIEAARAHLTYKREIEPLLRELPIGDALEISLEKVNEDKTLYAKSRWHEKNIWNAANIAAKLKERV